MPNRGRACAAILEAARSEFGKHGFEGAALRSIARGAEVDVALIPYYFAAPLVGGDEPAAVPLPTDGRR